MARQGERSKYGPVRGATRKANPPLPDHRHELPGSLPAGSIPDGPHRRMGAGGDGYTTGMFALLALICFVLALFGVHLGASTLNAETPDRSPVGGFG